MKRARNADSNFICYAPSTRNKSQCGAMITGNVAVEHTRLIAVSEAFAAEVLLTPIQAAISGRLTRLLTLALRIRKDEDGAVVFASATDNPPCSVRNGDVLAIVFGTMLRYWHCAWFRERRGGREC